MNMEEFKLRRSGRKAIKIEFIVGEDISPFDLPDFETVMPRPEDYVFDDS